MCINHLSGFLLAAELRPLLEAGHGGRVVTLTSSAALDCDPQGLSDINWAHRKFDRRQAYCLSKACSVLAADELAHRGRGGLRACSVDPGPCATQIVRYSQPQRARQRLGMTEEQLAKQVKAPPPPPHQHTYPSTCPSETHCHIHVWCCMGTILSLCTHLFGFMVVQI